ncbi:MAG: patatin family protein [Lachnospiraceae bacterium]|nr:patatin family protein [Lachnospiraceae bacterium]
MEKIGLVVEGGGMKCAYSAGVLDKFIDCGINFDYVIGVSAGSANTASYLAGQRDRNLRFYTDYTDDPKYLSIKNFFEDGQVFGLQYIYGTLSNSDGLDPLDFEALKNNPAEYEIVATRRADGKPVYFNKSDLKPDDYTAIMASCALPVYCKPVKYKGKYYYDGGVSDAIPAKRAFDRGCDRIVVITSKPRGFVKKPEGAKHIYHQVLKDFPNLVDAIDNRHVMYQKAMRQLKKYESEGKAFVFAPSNPPKMSSFTKDPATERELYDLGLSDFENLKADLLTFLNKSDSVKDVQVKRVI